MNTVKIEVKIYPIEGHDGRVGVEFDETTLGDLLRLVAVGASGKILYVPDVAKALGKKETQITNWRKSDKRGPIPFSYDNGRPYVSESAFFDWLTGACKRRRDTEFVRQVFGFREPKYVAPRRPKHQG